MRESKIKNDLDHLCQNAGNKIDNKKEIINNLRSRYTNTLNQELADKSKEEEMLKKVFETTSHYK